MTQAPDALETAVHRYGRSALCFDFLEQSERYRSFESVRVPGAVVPYRSSGRVDIVMGDPLAPESEIGRVTTEFLASRPRDRAVLGFATAREFALAAAEAGAISAQITAEPVIDPTEYEPSGGSAKKLRQHVRQSRADGAKVTSIKPGRRRSRSRSGLPPTA
jgi:lysylphosphatidylglycerol synthetase-like protein (DUF2156 family)